MNVKVSIIVPCWNVEKYLDKCVESLINQTLTDIEIILVDDLSPDMVPKMCDEWAKKDSRIRVIHKHVNEGLGMACNSGLLFASGEYVAFCDSDDWVDSNMYQVMYNYANKHDLDAVFTGIKRVADNGEFIGTLHHPLEVQSFCGTEQINKLICDIVASEPSKLVENPIQPSAKVVLYKRDVLLKHNLLFVSERVVPSEDIIFNINFLSKSTSVCVLPFYFYNYRVNPKSITRTLKDGQFEATVKKYIFLRDYCKELNLGDVVQERIKRLFIATIRYYVFLVCRSNKSLSEKIHLISQIKDNNEWKTVWNTYPTDLMPIYHRLVGMMINFNLWMGIYLLTKIKR